MSIPTYLITLLPYLASWTTKALLLASSLVCLRLASPRSPHGKASKTRRATRYSLLVTTSNVQIVYSDLRKYSCMLYNIQIAYSNYEKYICTLCNIQMACLHHRKYICTYIMHDSLFLFESNYFVYSIESFSYVYLMRPLQMVESQLLESQISINK